MKRANKILFIDSNLASYFLASASFSKKEIEIVPAVSGREAIRLLRDNPFFDLIITEIALPDMDGFSLLKEIRKINPIIPVIVQTECFLEDIKRKCLSAGINSLLEKPVSLKQLEREVNKYINYIHI